MNSGSSYAFWPVVVVCSLLFLIFTFSFFGGLPLPGHATEYGSVGMGPGMMGGYGMGWFGSIFMIVFWVTILAGLFFLIRRFIVSRGGQQEAWAGSTALEMLKQRYAQGEIDREEFEQKKRDLETA